MASQTAASQPADKLPRWEILSGDSWTTEFELPPLARANTLAGRNESSPIQEADVVRIILELASSADNVDPEVLLREINEERSVANVPLVEDIDLIRSALAERRRHYRHLAWRLLDDFPTRTLVGLVTELAGKATEGAQKRASTLVEDIVEDYETAAQAFMDGERQNIRKLLALIQIRAKRGEREFDGLVESLRKTLANWNYVNKPIQMINWGNGLDHMASRRLALQASALCAELRSRDGLAHTADKISEGLNDCARPSELSVQPSTVSSIARAAEDKCRKEPSAELDDFKQSLADSAEIARLAAPLADHRLIALSRLKGPWNERNGRFSPLKAAVFAGLFVPAVWILYLAATGALDPKIVTEMNRGAGLWAIRFLTLSLLVTPLVRGARYPKLVAVRRMVGIAAFTYATAHLALYVLDQHFALSHIASEIALRFYLTIGFVAWLGLAALAATSTDAMIRRLGPKWNWLHSTIYALALIGLLHFMIAAKADVSEPVTMTGLFAVLMLFRVFVKRGATAWEAALASAVISPPLTALIEAAWYMVVRHIPFWEVLGANIDLDMAFRPSAYVAVAGAGIAMITFLREGPIPRPSAASLRVQRRPEAADGWVATAHFDALPRTVRGPNLLKSRA
jgi:methionine sulfoxide reductase heme-binding subunit